MFIFRLNYKDTEEFSTKNNIGYLNISLDNNNNPTIFSINDFFIEKCKDIGEFINEEEESRFLLSDLIDVEKQFLHKGENSIVNNVQMECKTDNWQFNEFDNQPKTNHLVSSVNDSEIILNREKSSNLKDYQMRSKNSIISNAMIPSSHRRKEENHISFHLAKTVLSQRINEKFNESVFSLNYFIKYVNLNWEKFSDFTFLGSKKIIKQQKYSENKKISENFPAIYLFKIYFRYDVHMKILHFVFIDDSKIEFKLLLQGFIQQIGMYLHDFKNPLITTSEKIIELKEVINASLEKIKTEVKNIINFQVLYDEMSFINLTVQECLEMVKTYEVFARNIFMGDKPIELRYEKFNLFELTDYLSKWMYHKIKKAMKNLEFLIYVDPSIENKYYIKNDKLKLKQVLMNILSNSFKFTNDGKIVLKITKMIEAEKHYLRFEVEDTGIGMNKTFVESIFNPFVSNHSDKYNHNGCGLGLVICKNLTTSLGKTIKVESEENKGSKFWFYCEEKDWENMNIPSINSDNSSRKTKDDMNFSRESEKFLSSPELNVSKDRSLYKNEIYPPQKSDPRLPLVKTKKSNDTIVYNNCYIIDPEIKKKYNLEETNITNNDLLDKSQRDSSSFSHLSVIPHHISFIIIPNNLLDTNIEHNKNKNTKGISILIVDDDESNRKSISKLFKEMKNSVYNVKELDDGIDLMIMFFKRELNNYDMIFIDNQMKYFDGIEVVNLIDLMKKENFGKKAKLDYNILKKIIICSGDKYLVQEQVSYQDIIIEEKPIDKEKIIDICKSFGLVT